MDAKKKEPSAITDTIARTALGFIRFKNALGRKSPEDNGEAPSYAQRVNADPYAPFVKSCYLKTLRYDKKDERPFDKLDKAQSMAQVFREAVAMYGPKACLGFRNVIDRIDDIQPDKKVFKKLKLSTYNFHSYNTVDAQVELYGRGLRAVGVEPHQNVVLLAETRWEWMAMAQALLRQNMPIATLYSSLSDEAIVHGIRETEAKVVITTRDFLERLREHFAEIAQLTHIIYMENEIAPRPKPIEGKTLLSLAELERTAKAAKGEFEEIPPTPDDTAILMYTSGSTGMPKAVILTHRNMLAAARGLCEVFERLKVNSETDRYIAYLPLAHVFELNCEMISILYGVRIGYSSPLTLTDNGKGLVAGQKGDCTLLQPTIMPSVPMVLDRVKKAVLEKAAAKGATALRVLELAIEDSVRRFKAGQDTTVYDKDVFSKIRSVVGGRIRLVATGSAPLAPDTHDFMRAALGCHVLQGYGLTESCAAATCMEFTDNTVGGVGAPVTGALIRLVDWPEGHYLVSQGRGEIIIGGEMIAAGYYKKPELTNESFFEEDGVRWFRTGDIGEVTPQGTFKIIDRKKDLVKLQHGEYVSLGKIETELKTNQFVEQACVYGNGLQNYLVALIQINEANLKLLANQAGTNADRCIEELCQDPDIVRLVLNTLQSQLKRHNFNKAEIPLKITLCPEEWTPESNLVTTTFKLRRKEIEARFEREIAQMYATNE